ncbi:MAG: PAS domain S-box protein [Chloroflexota bacterium]
MPERKRQLDRIEANDNSANYLKAVLDSSQHGIMAFSSVRDDNDVIVDFRWELVNRVSEMLTGRTANDLNGKHLLVEMPGNAEDGLFDQYVLVVETGIPLDIEHYYEHEGIKTWFHITACKMMDGFVVTFANITEQKNLQEELEQKYRELDEFFHVTPDMLCIADLDGTFLKVNHAWEKALGYTREELEGKPFLSFVHPDDVEKTIQAVAQLENGQGITQFQNRYRHANGSYRILDWHTSPNPNGKIGYSAARDVTADQAMIAMLENSEKRFSLAFHNSPVAMVMTSRTEAGSVFMDANQAYLDLIGYEWHEIAGETTQSLNLSIEGTSSAKRLHLLDTQGEYNKLETVLQVRDGTKHHILGSGQRSMMYDTPIDIDILLDITDRKRAAAQAFALKMEKARSELLTDFIQNSSHEFRTPLAIIKTSMYLLSRTQDEAKQQRHIGVIDLQIE